MRQVRQLERLSEFNIKIIYQLDKKNTYTNTLTKQKSTPLTKDDDYV